MLIQTTLYAPPNIEAGLMSGDLMRIGSVVRDKLGVIVDHLDEVPDFSDVANQVASVGSRLRAAPNKTVIIVASVTGVVAAACVATTVVRHQKRNRNSAGGAARGSAATNVEVSGDPRQDDSADGN